MYVLASHLRGLPIISLQSGEIIALIHKPLVEISGFEIVALKCDAVHQRQHLVILPQDIQQLSNNHITIESEDELIEPHEIIRLRKPLEDHFEPIGKPVISELERHVGRITDYTINLESNYIQKLYVGPVGIKFWFRPEIIIDRTQIVDVTAKRIIVRDTAITAPILPPEVSPNSPS